MQNIQLISVSPAVCVDWFHFPYEPAVGACLRIFLTAWVNLFPGLDAAYVIIQSMSSESSPSVYQGAAVFILHFTSGSTKVGLYPVTLSSEMITGNAEGWGLGKMWSVSVTSPWCDC